MQILIAEDEPISRRVLQSFLVKWGYDVVVTEDGQQAWDKLRGPDAPHLAVLDWMMPGVDGLQVCRNVRTIERAQRTYILMLTAKTHKDDIVTALEAGADDYLTKPFDPEELRARLHAGERILQLQGELNQRIHELENAMETVGLLQGLQPICCYCKKIRNDKNYWEQLESYVSEHSEAQFSHGICPECMEKIVKPDVDALKLAEDRRRNGEG